MKEGKKELIDDRQEQEKEKHPFYQIKKALEAQRDALLEEAGVILGHGVNARGEAFPDLADQATAEANQNFTLRLREREQKLLKKIEDAIARIADGSFGICEACGEEIGVKRLMARPVTTLCIDCKTEQEAQEKIGR